MSEPLRKTKRFELAVMLAGFILLAVLFVFGTRSSGASGSETKPTVIEAQDFSRFLHSNPMHARMPCLLCHKRDDNSAAPKLSGHVPCSGCHVQQFADGGSQICTICHTNAATGAVKRFPRLRSFSVRFDHSRHVRQTNCATCHKPSRQGAALSVPSGVGAHTTCYQCHGPRTEVGGRNIGSCGTCHVPGMPQRNSDASAAFAKNFDHGEHRRSGNLNCSSCHTVRPGSARGRQVSAPAVSMHFAPTGGLSCGACHNNKRAFGGNDFTDCKRCHQNGTFRF